MSDEDKSNGLAKHEVEMPLGELLERDLGGLQEPDTPTVTSNPAFLFIFFSALLLTLAFCLPSIIGGADTVRRSQAAEPRELHENRAAQQDLQRTVQEIESALQNPQGE